MSAKSHKQSLHVACWPSEDGDELGTMNDVHARPLPNHHADKLDSDSDGRNQGLNNKGQPRTEFPDHPARHKEVHSAAKGRRHAKQTPLLGRAGSNLPAAASVAGTTVRGMSVVEGVALQQVEYVKEPTRR